MDDLAVTARFYLTREIIPTRFLKNNSISSYVRACADEECHNSLSGIGKS